MANRPFSLIPREQQIKILRQKYLSLVKFIQRRLFLKRYDSALIKKLIKEINAEIVKINAFTFKWLDKNIDIYYNQAFDSMSKRWKKKGFEDGNKVDSEKSKSDRLKQAKKRFKKANDSIVKNVSQYFALIKTVEKETKVQIQNLRNRPGVLKATNKIISRGIKGGASRNMIAERIQDLYINKFGKIDFIEIPLKGGGVRRYTPESYSEMVARTELKTLETQATLDATVKAGGDLVMFSQHANPCEICAQFEGNIYSISGNDPVYPPIDAVIPVHPNCEHYYIPVTNSDLKAMRKAGKIVNPPISILLPEALANIKKVREGKTKGVPGRLVSAIGTVIARREKEKDND